MASKAWKQKLRSQPTGFEQWGGYMDAKIQKLNEQFALKTVNEEQSEFSIDKIFSGVAIFVNGHTNPSAEDLKTLMAKHGGIYHTYSQSNTTHIIATNLPHFKIQKLRDHHKIVRPEWITDSITAGKLLSCSEYQLYTSSYKQGQTKLEFNKSATNTSLSGNECLEESETNKSVNKNTSEYSQSGSDSTEPNTVPENTSDIISTPVVPLEDESGSKIITSTPRTDEINETTDNISSINIVKSPPKVVKAGQPNFLSDYYNHSRLHHISTAAADFKDFVNQLHVNHKGDFPGRDLFVNWMKTNSICDSIDENIFSLGINQKVIMHLDMDCFFVSVALRNHPELVGKPVAVTHGKSGNAPNRQGTNVDYEYNYYKNRYKSNALIKAGEETGSEVKVTDYDAHKNIGSTSEVASCSYEARQCGVKNGMYLGEAFRRCPDLQVVPYDFEGYTEVSQALYNLVASLTLDIEAISCDEMFIDCTDVLKSTGGSPLELASFLREEIHKLTRCMASAGIGGSILVARLATRCAKPNGQYFVKQHEEKDFMKKQLVRSLPGVGYATQSRLEALNVVTCEDLQGVSLNTLQKEFGPKTGKTLFDHCRGKDDRVVKTEKERKSVSAEINYGMRFQTQEEPETFLRELSEEVEKRLKKINRRGKLITLKIKVRSKDAPVETVKFMGHGICDNIAKSMTVHLPTDSADLISKEAIACLRQMKLPPQDIRGMGIQVSRLAPVIGMEKNQSTTLLSLFKKAASTSTSIQEQLQSSSVTKKEESATNVTGLEETLKIPHQEDNLVGEKVPDMAEVAFPDLESIASETEGVPAEEDKLDESFLNAMPEDIRREIIEDFKSRKAVAALANINSPNKRMVGLGGMLNNNNKKASTPKKRRSPTKKTSPSKRKKPLPAKKSYSLSNFLNIKSANVGASASNETNKVPATATNSRRELVKAALCGAVDLEPQRQIIAEWVKSTEPLEDDTNHFMCFLLTLIDNRDLERLDLIIKCLYRNIKKSTKDEWKAIYGLLIDEVQREMKQNYGTVLKCETF